MKKVVALFLICLYVLPVRAQDGFYFEKEYDKVSVPFKLIDNLIFIPIKVNGMELNFLLDSGVEETVLFSLEDKKEINFFNVEKITLRGLGSDEPIEALKSTNNVLDINGVKSTNHLLYIVLDQEFNLSSRVGIPVNGIIGYSFLKNNLVEINYKKRKLFIYKDTELNKRKLEKRFQELPISIEKSKPYLISNLNINGNEMSAKLLIDIGNSDAVWLFPNISKSIQVPAKNFDDFLGKGFSGDVEGKRARISKFSIANFVFNKPLVAFPDSSSVKNVKMVPDRVGSVGGEILKRFTIVFDYSNGKFYLKKNNDFNLPFNYNKSGIELQNHGLEWVKETVPLENVPLNAVSYDPNAEKVVHDFKYKFALKPVYEIANLRKNSPAANCGLQKGDIIVSINKEKGYKYSLQQINTLLKSEDDKWIVLEIEREGQILKFKFQLEDVL